MCAGSSGDCLAVTVAQGLGTAANSLRNLSAVLSEATPSGRAVNCAPSDISGPVPLRTSSTITCETAESCASDASRRSRMPVVQNSSRVCLVLAASRRTWYLHGHVLSVTQYPAGQMLPVQNSSQVSQVLAACGHTCCVHSQPAAASSM